MIKDRRFTTKRLHSDGANRQANLGGLKIVARAFPEGAMGLSKATHELNIPKSLVLWKHGLDVRQQPIM